MKLNPLNQLKWSKQGGENWEVRKSLYPPVKLLEGSPQQVSRTGR
jgi:hypothetical protein